MEPFTPSDRPLLVIADQSVCGATPVQRHASLLSRQYRRELGRVAAACPALAWYDDWEPGWAGPNSRGLKSDLDACIRDGLVCTHPASDTVLRALGLREYFLSRAGSRRRYAMRQTFPREADALRDRVEQLQDMEYERLLEGVYYGFPEYVRRADAPQPA